MINEQLCSLFKIRADVPQHAASATRVHMQFRNPWLPLPWIVSVGYFLYPSAMSS